MLRSLGGIAVGSTLLACAHPSARAPSDAPHPVARAELVETAPVETKLDHPEIPNADESWLRLLRNARHKILLEHFYASAEGHHRLAPVLEELERATARGVKVRMLVDVALAKEYAPTLDRLRHIRGLELRITKAFHERGGVQHAKFMVVDSEFFFVGSQNFDWRALEHVHEIGIEAHAPELARALETLFRQDWDEAAGQRAPSPVKVRAATASLSDGGSLRLAASPSGDARGGLEWDLPKLVAAIAKASRDPVKDSQL